MNSSFFEKKFLPIASKIGNQRHLLALRDGIMFAMPLMIIGSFFIIVAWLEADWYQNFMSKVFGENWNAFGDIVYNGSMGIIALVAVFGVAYSLASSYKVDKKNIDGVPAGVLALASYLIVNIMSTFKDGKETVSAWSPDLFGAQYLFVGLIIAIITAEIYRYFLQKKIIITLPDTVPPTVSRSFTALIPGFVIILFFLLVRYGFSHTGWGDFATFVHKVVTQPFTILGSTYVGTLVACLMEHLLWSFGIHGSSIITSVMEPIWITNADANLEALKAGKTLPHIITYTFYENGIWMGGSGATLPVAIYMTFLAKSKLLKKVGRLAIGPSIFNVNEPIMFGVPIVLNPFLMIPYILAPVAVLTVTYFGTAMGIFPHTTGTIIPWTTPYFISGYLMTGGKIMGVVMQLVAFAVASIIWFPFIRIWDKKNLEMEKASK
ncbi:MULTISPECIES: PTS cellobiose transporter subunit IIC [Bacillaceae]|uniref:Permease IIC component n=1 Tax=Gottfriedia luciferensis TaxID=178774 RepID=A0ABX2ZWV2_9BACI|nr:MULTISPECIES: PTS cellobiose transporter subunit IIC [Bacillaceae]ODG93027.1 PTS system, cellobiose-specific IIC component [Gottfriedia luciferensis]PGZ92876.1 PTS system, cellobiose-specific IIC component [Bacillus sp. AFS029533]SFD69236.1 PTS system, cellobiose-specific IIC component [Bacillus sp. UNCCL81]